MPQITLDYSANVLDAVDVSLLAQIHTCVSTTIDCPINTIKSRIMRIDDFLIGDGLPQDGKEQAFVTLWVQVMPGRTTQSREMLANKLKQLLDDYFIESSAKLALQIRISLTELDAEFYVM